ncbi:MAG TPA: pitrilysin family protein [Acidobacteriota bacterium]|jgi:zinc protease
MRRLPGVLFLILLLCSMLNAEDKRRVPNAAKSDARNRQASRTASPPAAARFFPYAIQKKTLANGLDVLVVEMPEFKSMLSYNTLVLAGARNEIEKGKSGLAHLFEHILFRHRFRGEQNGYERRVNEMGVFNNAWTWFDVTFYHPLTFTSNLNSNSRRAGLAELEADRFTRLDFTEEIFKTEAGAVLGEYRKNASQPARKMEEVMFAAAFGSHGYGHTTMGYLEDVEDMPNEYRAAVQFYNQYYRPNNAVLTVAGDVKTQEIFDVAQRYYGAWEAKPQPKLPLPEPAEGPKRNHVPWSADVPPQVHMAYRVPAFKTGDKETAVGQILPELLASETAPLYKKLRYDKKTASELSLTKQNYESFHPRLLIVETRLFKEKFDKQGTGLLDETIADLRGGLQDLKSWSKRKDAPAELKQIQSKYRYDLLAQLGSPANLAETLAWFYRFDRDPEVLDKTIAAVESLTPADIDTFAKKYFIPANEVVVTMTGGK